MSESREVLLSVRNLTKKFPILGGVFSREVAAVHAVNGVSFDVYRGETLGLVGESGCGKSTLGRSLLRLIEPTSGEVRFKGVDVVALRSAELRRLRRSIQIIFQDPYASLNPRMTVEELLSEPLRLHKICPDRASARLKIAKLLDLCGLRRESISKYPHEFSGGQRQRISIARALAVEPEFLVCDEPVSALDVSIQAQIINLLQDLQKELKLTYLFIAHDLKVVEHISNRVAVMYLGKIVEIASSENLYKNPQHPYTKALLSAIPIPDPEARERRAARVLLKGDLPSPVNPPSGCPFHPRCPIAVEACRTRVPVLKETRQDLDAHQVACDVVAP